MRRFVFTVFLTVGIARAAAAQRVPGRDLLDFPIATVAELPALATMSGDGFWNPATASLHEGRGRLSVATLNAPDDQGVSMELVAGAAALPGRTTVGLSAIRAQVANLVRTETDPFSTGTIDYNTTVLSAVATREQGAHAVTGVALRYRTGQADTQTGSALGVDAGVMATALFGIDGRIGLASVLWRPGAGTVEASTFDAAADARLAGSDARNEVRAGYAFSYTSRLDHEGYALLSGRAGLLEARLGLARVAAFDEIAWHTRFGVGLHYARYSLGIAREDARGGLGPTYQFSLSTIVQ